MVLLVVLVSLMIDTMGNFFCNSNYIQCSNCNAEITSLLTNQLLSICAKFDVYSTSVISFANR